MSGRVWENSERDNDACERVGCETFSDVNDVWMYYQQFYVLKSGELPEYVDTTGANEGEL